MLMALTELHPKIAVALTATVNAAADDASKAKALFCGMLNGQRNNVQKGSFAQALAQVIADPKLPFTVPVYIQDAIKHACQIAGKP